MIISIMLENKGTKPILVGVFKVTFGFCFRRVAEERYSSLQVSEVKIVGLKIRYKKFLSPASCLKTYSFVLHGKENCCMTSIQVMYFPETRLGKSNKNLGVIIQNKL
jgi:hypothetical protein